MAKVVPIEPGGRAVATLKRKDRTECEILFGLYVYASGHPKVEPMVWELSFDENGAPRLVSTILKVERQLT